MAAERRRCNSRLREECGTPRRHESVALPAFGCFDVASAAIGADVPVSLYDIDPDTLSPDPDSLSRAFSQGARVAVIAPLYGVPVDWESLEAMRGAVWSTAHRGCGPGSWR